MRFLKAREGNVTKAHKMVRQKSLLPLHVRKKKKKKRNPELLNLDYVILQLVDCLKWRVQNDIDGMLAVSSSMEVLCKIIII